MQWLAEEYPLTTAHSYCSLESGSTNPYNHK